MSTRKVFVTGALVTGLGVALGAFGAHGLKDYTDAAGLAIWETGVRYQVLHGLALLVLALSDSRFSTTALKAIFLCFFAGVLIFSGSLYILMLSGIRWLGAITPIGGVLMLAGWTLMAIRFEQYKR